MNYINYLKNKNLSSNTIKTYLIWANKWKRFINNKKVNKKNFILYIKYLEKKQLKPNSIRLAYSCTKSLLMFQKYRLINNIRLRLPKEEIMEKSLVNRNLLKQELLRLDINNFYNKRIFIIIYILLNTGIRAFELLSLKWENIFENRIYIKGKGNKSRIVFIDNVFFKYINKQKSGYLISKKGTNEKISQKQLNLIVKHFSLKIKQEFTPHDLRRSFCTHLIRNGCNIKIVQKLMGHSNISVTSRYIFTTEDEMYESYSKIINKK